MKALLGALLGAWVLVPLALLGVWSFSLRWYDPALLPQEWSPRAWTSVLSPTSRVAQALGNSAAIAVAVALLSVLIALPAARALLGSSWRGRGALLGALLSPLVLPAFASVMGVQVVFLRFGLGDTHLGVVLAHLIPAVPYAALLLLGTLRQYDARLEEQARMLGARAAQVAWRVTLPLLLPGLAVAALAAFLVSWSEYLLTLVVGGAGVLTLPLLLFSAAQGGDLALTSALCLLYVAPPVLLALLTLRFRAVWDA